jgi:hypothetical protein
LCSPSSNTWLRSARFAGPQRLVGCAAGTGLTAQALPADGRHPSRPCPRRRVGTQPVVLAAARRRGAWGCQESATRVHVQLVGATSGQQRLGMRMHRRRMCGGCRSMHVMHAHVPYGTPRLRAVGQAVQGCSSASPRVCGVAARSPTPHYASLAMLHANAPCARLCRSSTPLRTRTRWASPSEWRSRRGQLRVATAAWTQHAPQGLACLPCRRCLRVHALVHRWYWCLLIGNVLASMATQLSTCTSTIVRLTAQINLGTSRVCAFPKTLQSCCLSVAPSC